MPLQIYPQEPVYSIPNTTFGVAAIKAALDNVRVLFVGPDGVQGKLERTALRMCQDDGDLRLRAEVLYNFLALGAALSARVGNSSAASSPTPCGRRSTTCLATARCPRARRRPRARLRGR